MAPTAARPRGGGCRPTGRRPPPLLIAALVFLAMAAAVPRPAAAGCSAGDEELDGSRCRALCTSSLRPCFSSQWWTCGSWFWRRSCCRSSAVVACANQREWARCYCSIDSVRAAGVVLLVAVGLVTVAALVALAMLLRRRRKAAAQAATVAPVYGGYVGEAGAAPPPPPVYGYPPGGVGGEWGGGPAAPYQGYPPPQG